jgi:hypothetical protein
MSDPGKVAGQQYTEHGEQKTIGVKYVPRYIRSLSSSTGSSASMLGISPKRYVMHRLPVFGEEFGFYESWLEGNRYGMRAEPWHWQYRSST